MKTTAVLASILVLSCSIGVGSRRSRRGARLGDQPVARLAPVAPQELQVARRERAQHQLRQACRAPPGRMSEEE